MMASTLLILIKSLCDMTIEKKILFKITAFVSFFKYSLFFHQLFNFHVVEYTGQAQSDNCITRLMHSFLKSQSLFIFIVISLG